MSETADIQHQQHDAMPRDDLKPYAGEWVALREGHVIASDIDAVALRNNPEVQETDTLTPVPPDGAVVLML